MVDVLALSLEQRAVLKATALPLPEVALGEKVTLGFRDRKTVTTVVIGEQVLVRRVDGSLAALCGVCSQGGLRPEYAHVFDGQCFYCRGTGLRAFAADEVAAKRKVRSAQAADIRRAAKAEIEAPAIAAAEAAALAASIEIAHGAALTEQARRDAEAAAFEAQRFLGSVGDKITVVGTVKVNAHVESRYGSSRLVIIEAEGGVTLKTFGTSAFHYDVEVGDEVEVTATVKDHEVYRGVKQTAIVRPKGKVLASA